MGDTVRLREHGLGHLGVELAVAICVIGFLALVAYCVCSKDDPAEEREPLLQES